MLFCLSSRTLRPWPALITLWLAAACHTSFASVSAEPIRKALESGQLDTAVRLLQQEKTQFPNDPQVRFFEGVILAQQGQTDKAIEAFRRLTESHPGMIEAYNNLGVLHASKGRLEEARKALEAGLMASSSTATLHRNLSDVQSQLTRQTYAKALQIDGKNRATAPQLALLGSLDSGTMKSTAVPAPAQVLAQTAPPITPAPSGNTSSPSGVPVPVPVPVPAPALRPTASATQSAPAAPAVTPVREGASTPSPVAAAPTSTTQANKPLSSSSSPASPEKSTVNTDTEKERIRSTVIAWAKAWSRKDVSSYLSAYASNFTPAEKVSRAKWEEERKLRILSKKKISVEVRALKIAIEGSHAVAQFQQIYESDNFSGNSRKTLDMIKQQGQWLIVRETVN